MIVFIWLTCKIQMAESILMGTFSFDLRACTYGKTHTRLRLTKLKKNKNKSSRNIIQYEMIQNIPNIMFRFYIEWISETTR